MDIIKNPELRQVVFDNIRATVDKPRTGIHLSDLIYCPRKAYYRKISPVTATDEQCLLWLTGYSFQAYMFPSDKEVTITIDGIDCTPDILRLKTEVKSTRQSSKKFDPYEMKHWLRQILGYCKATGSLEYDLVVMFTAGNYAPPFPNLDCWHIKATQEEVDNNWAQARMVKGLLEEAYRTGTPPPALCMDWEWEYCEHWEQCIDTLCYKKRLARKK
jgi:hypothetical protein